MTAALPREVNGLPVPTLQDIFAAERRIRPFLPETPVIAPPALAQHLEARVHVKCENLRPTGAFKICGGINLVSAESGLNHIGEPPAADVRGPAGFVTASTGNHGQSIAYAAHLFGVPATIFVPENPNPVKVASIRRFHAQVVEVGRDLEEAREAAEAHARRHGLRWVHPVGEPLLVAGVATVTLEFLRWVPELEVLFVPVGSGSGACGAAIVAKTINPTITLVAVQAQAAPAVHDSWRSGQVVKGAPMATVAEGLATRSAHPYPLGILRAALDDFILVSDEEMAAAVRVLLFEARQVAEEAGAAALAGAMKRPDLTQGRTVGIVLSGGNLAPQRLAGILPTQLRRARRTRRRLDSGRR